MIIKLIDIELTVLKRFYYLRISLLKINSRSLFGFLIKYCHKQKELSLRLDILFIFRFRNYN
jgi:hypothetical protein